jgi:hypothetical protein
MVWSNRSTLESIDEMYRVCFGHKNVYLEDLTQIEGWDVSLGRVFR